MLNSNIRNILYKNIQQKNSPNIIAVDGTYSTMKASLCEEGYNDALRAEFVLRAKLLKTKSNKNGESVTPLITTPKASLTKERSSFSLTGMFNVTCDRWICFADSPHGFEEGVNERTKFFLFNAKTFTMPFWTSCRLNQPKNYVFYFELYSV